MDSDTLIKPAKITRNRYINNYLSTDFGGVQWSRLKPNAPPRITLDLLDELLLTQKTILDNYARNKPIKYHVMSSDIPRIFSLGGDLKLFSECALNKDLETLKAYAINSIKVVYQSSTNYNLPITTISLIKGAALGGGFEAALACNTIIAEKQSTFAFPETRFGLFPGMGAYTFLRQRVAPRIAEEIIYSSKTYSAEALYNMGVIDVLCNEGQGYKTTEQYIQKMSVRHQGIHALRKAVQQYSSVDKKELLSIVEHWVKCVMQLSDKQLRLITILAKTSTEYEE